MKVIKGLLLFTGFVVLASACFDPPEFPDTPEIDFESIYFREVGTIVEPDSLVLTISFQDGDGDLGLGPEETSNPYHPSNYFLRDSVPVATWIGSTQENPPRVFSPILDLQENQSGTLATLDKFGQSGFEFMEEYVFPYTCTNYQYDTLYIMESDIRVIDPSYNIVDTITDVQPNLYVVVETFYYAKNPNHNNITVDFYIINADGSETELDWETLNLGTDCGQSFDGRFPVLSDSKKALEGDLHYAMKSSGFVPLLGGKTMQLEVQIKDQAPHNSNVIRTPKFTLEQIRR